MQHRPVFAHSYAVYWERNNRENAYTHCGPFAVEVRPWKDGAVKRRRINIVTAYLFDMQHRTLRRRSSQRQLPITIRHRQVRDLSDRNWEDGVSVTGNMLLLRFSEGLFQRLAILHFQIRPQKKPGLSAV